MHSSNEADLNNIADGGLRIADLKSEFTNPKSEMIRIGLTLNWFYL
jgi:hypothetical protein